MMALLGNLIWFVFGGVVMGLLWWLAGLLCCLIIIGIPWAKACFVIGTFSFFPFGKDVVSRKAVTGQNDIGTGVLGVIGNILWFIVLGWCLALGHLLSALLCFITIIGIPFGLQHLKLVRIALFPIGMTIVPLR